MALACIQCVHNLERNTNEQANYIGISEDNNKAM